LFVVCHENLVRPDGPESFDVAHCLDLIAGQTIARKKYLAPVSGWNRQCAEDWMQSNPTRWQLAPVDWTNICDFDLKLATSAPADRRGRHSRPGLEKFPPLPALMQMFPPTCEAVRMLGADSLLSATCPPHWDLLPFGAETVDRFLGTIDFFVYFTHPFLQESFGRVIAEALAAGKVVITSAATGATFGEGVIAAQPDQVDQIIAAFIADPESYAAQVRRGHAALANFGVTAFQQRFETLIGSTGPETANVSRMEMVYDLL
jgi:glycosyltransferase involved in cell wall biosynthesis